MGWLEGWTIIISTPNEKAVGWSWSHNINCHWYSGILLPPAKATAQRRKTKNSENGFPRQGRLHSAEKADF